MTSRAKRLRTKYIYSSMKFVVRHIKRKYINGHRQATLSKEAFTHDLIRSLNYLGIEYTVKLIHVNPYSERCKGSKSDTYIKLIFIPKR